MAQKTSREAAEEFAASPEGKALMNNADRILAASVLQGLVPNERQAKMDAYHGILALLIDLDREIGEGTAAGAFDKARISAL